MPETRVLPAVGVQFDLSVPVAIIGAGACGLTAALAVHDAGVEAIVLERDPITQGSTALSSGMIPACGSRLQHRQGIVDTPEIMVADIQRKADQQANPDVLNAVCAASGPTIDWLIDDHEIELSLVEGFLYPGHSKLRMHAPLSRTGADLISSLLQACARADIDIINNAHVTGLFVDETGAIKGLQLQRPDGSSENLACQALILACNGYGGNPELVKQYIPEIADAWYFGHAGNQGDAVLWGQGLGAAIEHMGAYQGHGSVATPHGILITWALMMEGGYQVNANAQRFSNEHHGYSEQAVAVLAQPEQLAWNIYDQRRHELGMEFEDYRHAWELGAIKTADSLATLAQSLGLPAAELVQTNAEVEQCVGAEKGDIFGRDFTAKPALKAPFYGVKVTGALFHTQGGLVVNTQAQVLRPDGTPIANLFAGGGATCGLSGASVAGYLSGNGLLTAVVLGRIAGQSASNKILSL